MSCGSAGPGGAAEQLVDDPVVPLDDGVAALMVRQPRKRDAHTPTMRSMSGSGITIFPLAAAAPGARVTVRGRTRHHGDDRPRPGEDPVHLARVRARPAVRLLRPGGERGARRAAGAGVQDAGRGGGRRHARRRRRPGAPPARPQGARRRRRRQEGGDGRGRRGRAGHRLRGGRHLARRPEEAAAGRDRRLGARLAHDVLQRRAGAAWRSRSPPPTWSGRPARRSPRSPQVSDGWRSASERCRSARAVRRGRSAAGLAPRAWPSSFRRSPALASPPRATSWPVACRRPRRSPPACLVRARRDGARRLGRPRRQHRVRAAQDGAARCTNQTRPTTVRAIATNMFSRRPRKCSEESIRIDSSKIRNAE